MKRILSIYFDLTKLGIALFVLIGAVLGYALGFHSIEEFSPSLFVQLLAGLYLLSSGMFALNQVQEAPVDAKMNRTKSRPIPAGQIKPATALGLSVVLTLSGLTTLALLKPVLFWMSLFVVVLYNFFYTLRWKTKWAFAAVPGAIPGAMPVVFGYATANDQWLTMECFYLFAIMFLWQMPHFWAIALHFREDYERGGVPVLPVIRGERNTLWHIGVYTVAYAAVALASPWFVETRWLYLFLVIPFSAKILWDFYQYLQNTNKQNWLRFFIWVNLSVVVFLVAPVLDKWQGYLSAL